MLNFAKITKMIALDAFLQVFFFMVRFSRLPIIAIIKLIYKLLLTNVKTLFPLRLMENKLETVNKIATLHGSFL